MEAEENLEISGAEVRKCCLQHALMRFFIAAT